MKDFLYDPVKATYINNSGGVRAIADNLCNASVHVREAMLEILEIIFSYNYFGNVQNLPGFSIPVIANIRDKKMLKELCPNIPRMVLAIDGTTSNTYSAHPDRVLENIAERDPFILKPNLHYIDDDYLIKREIDNHENKERKYGYVGICSICGRRIYGNENYYVWDPSNDLLCNSGGEALKRELASYGEGRYGGGSASLSRNLVAGAVYYHHHKPPLLH